MHACRPKSAQDEGSGWCGRTDAHRDAQASATFDAPAVALTAASMLGAEEPAADINATPHTYLLAIAGATFSIVFAGAAVVVLLMTLLTQHSQKSEAITLPDPEARPEARPVKPLRWVPML